MKVCAVVVTYNRKELLGECLTSLLNQTRAVDEIVVVDNASTDGTYEYVKLNDLLKDNVTYLELNANVGGAGGFYKGMRYSYSVGCDYAWIMDDDTIPTPTALQELLNATETIGEKFSFLASSVFGPNNEAMNVPSVDQSPSSNGNSDWYKYLSKSIVRINGASFVSLLIPRDVITKCGYPCKDYFIWGDDTEYTMRIIKDYGPSYYVGKSIVIHKRVVSKPVSVKNEQNPVRIKMFYYFMRNNLVTRKAYNGRLHCYATSALYFTTIFSVLFHSNKKWMRIKTIIRAINDFNFKRYDSKSFKNRYKLDGQERGLKIESKLIHQANQD